MTNRSATGVSGAAGGAGDGGAGRGAEPFVQPHRDRVNLANQFLQGLIEGGGQSANVGESTVNDLLER